MTSARAAAAATRSYQIAGGHPVVGEITCLGAKNFATKAMVAAILGETPTTLTNVPAIGDTQITRELLSAIGVSFQEQPGGLVIDPGSLTTFDVPVADSGSNRVPILLLGALLQRGERASVPVLGGCAIGERKVDFHVEAIERFGGVVQATETGFTAFRRGRLRGTHLRLPYPSVGATETCLYLGVLAEGETVIANAAAEPEILELITMLRGMGAIIFTRSDRELHVEGVERLRGTTMAILGDRMEAASWACLAAACDGDILVRGVRPDTLGNFLSKFRSVGGGFELVGPGELRFHRDRPLTSTVIETDVYPGFSTDWQQPFAVLLTQSRGVSVIHETVYENRFGYLEALAKLGATTQVTAECLGGLPCRYKGRGHHHSAIVAGGARLRGVDELRVPDLRAGLAYVIAAAVAAGRTRVTGVELIERGYGDIVPRLASMGLDISVEE
jgi:UDP-N-acetylglucosamine 1-carboxyvinyltransferase